MCEIEKASAIHDYSRMLEQPKTNNNPIIRTKETMDKEILRAVVKSREEVKNPSENHESYEKSLNDDKFPVTERNVLAALARSFADLLSYRVSTEATQRYSVRIQVIEMLRDWMRPPMVIEAQKTFSQNERLLELVGRILAINSTKDAPCGEEVVDVVVETTRATIELSRRDERFSVTSERLLDRIAASKATESSQRLMLDAVAAKDFLKLRPETLERLYVALSRELIEEPLVDDFVDFLRNNETRGRTERFDDPPKLNELLKIAIASATIFQVASCALREIFVNTDYSRAAARYIESFLECARSRCRETGRDFLDLYPLSVQSRVIVLDIEPERHTNDSRAKTLDLLEVTRCSSPGETLTLLSHFPKWSRLVAERLAHSHGLEASAS